MTINKAFAAYLESETGAVLKETLFIGNAPSSNKAVDAIYWFTSSGGSPVRNATKESLKTYAISLYYRDRNYGLVDTTLSALEKLLNCASCVQLVGYDTMEIQAAVLSIDNDLDAEDRKVGLLQVTIVVYEHCSD
jgi:hypothetical protein